MPCNKVHSQQSLDLYGVDCAELHKWMDEPWQLFGCSHRKVRHSPTQSIPEKLIEMYGAEIARNAMLDHIMLDNMHSIRQNENIKDVEIKEESMRMTNNGRWKVAKRRTAEQWKEIWWPRIVNAISMLWYRDVDHNHQLELPTFNRIRSYINVPLRHQGEELFDLFSLYMNELVQQGKLCIEEIDRGRGLSQFYRFPQLPNPERSFKIGSSETSLSPIVTVVDIAEWFR